MNKSAKSTNIDEAMESCSMVESYPDTNTETSRTDNLLSSHQGDANISEQPDTAGEQSQWLNNEELDQSARGIPIPQPSRTGSLLKCYYFNARSLKNKLAELHLLLHEQTYDVISVSETWLDESIPDSLLLDGSCYSVFRCDRRYNHVGGGTCIFVKSYLHVKPVKVSSSAIADFNMETVCLDILSPVVKYRLIVCYIPPYHGAESTDHLKTFIASIESIIHCDASIVLMGDFNFPDIRWCKNDLSPVQCSRQDSSEFANFIQRYAFLQYVTEPTRLNNILDLVLCNDSFAVSGLAVKPCFSNSDHNAISFNLFFCTDGVNFKHWRYNKIQFRQGRLG